MGFLNLLEKCNVLVIEKDRNEVKVLERHIGLSKRDFSFWVCTEKEGKMFELTSDLLVILKEKRRVVIHTNRVSYVVSLPIIIPDDNRMW